MMFGTTDSMFEFERSSILPKDGVSSIRRTQRLDCEIVYKHRLSQARRSDILLHDNISQGIPQCMVLLLEFK